MITKKTVLVVGAGGSVPFGFPTGLKLKSDILEHPIRQALMNMCKYPPDEVSSFLEDLRKSGSLSVDAFLEYRKEYLDIGKAAIALALIPKEIPGSKLYDQSEGQTWYDYLLNKMKSSFDAFRDNKLTILTFNYDRSLDFYLREALSSNYGKKIDEVEECLSKIPIIHLYGQLGTLSERPYHSSELNKETIEKAASGIRIVHESTPITDQFKQARAALTEASFVYFVGFGYALINLRRLGVEQIPRNAQIFGSAYGMTDMEKGQVEKWFSEGMPPPIGNRIVSRIKLADNNYDALNFLRNVRQIDE